MHSQHQLQLTQQLQHRQIGAARRCTHLVILGALVLFAALVGVRIGARPSVFRAAPVQQTVSQRAVQASFRVPHEVGKTILGETSIDGPALWTYNSPPAARPIIFLA